MITPRIDAHQHFWRYNADQYPWILPGSPLQRDWLPPDLAVAQEDLGFVGSVAVQARQSVEETRWLLELAAATPRILGVVGWLDLCSAHFPAEVAAFTINRRLVGLRHVVQDEPDDRFVLRPDFMRGIAALRQFDLSYDLLILPRQLPAAIELVRRFPDQRFVVDHLAKPLIRESAVHPWLEQIRELAKAENVSCKLSGLVTEADHQHWKSADFDLYLEAVFSAFGPERLMFGSDWPVCLLAATYARVVGLIESYVRALAPELRAKIFGGNAARFYGLHRDGDPA